MSPRATSTPNVSVVIPLHNGEKWIGQAIRSVLVEPEVGEVVVVENGSSDNSLDHVDQTFRGNSRVRTLVLPESPSIPAARNFGVTASRLEFLAFIDQDDWWVQGRIARQMQQINASTSPCFSIGLQSFVLDLNDDEQTVPNWFRSDWLTEDQIGYVLGTLLIERNSFKQVGMLDGQFSQGFDDVDWFVRARKSGLEELRLPETILKRRVHHRNASANVAGRAESLRLIRKILDFDTTQGDN
jgi:glycosyltransferase involved in cell wall biosynthesis